MWKIYAIYKESGDRCFSVICFFKEEVKDCEISTDLRVTQVLYFNPKSTVYWLWDFGHNI